VRHLGELRRHAKVFGGYGERVTEPDQIVPAIRRGIRVTQEGQAVPLEFITDTELRYSSGGAGPNAAGTSNGDD
jgi:hypothetical protein